MEIDLLITLMFIGGAAPVNPCPRSARGGAVFFIVVGAFSRPKFIDKQGYFIDYTKLYNEALGLQREPIFYFLAGAFAPCSPISPPAHP